MADNDPEIESKSRDLVPSSANPPSVDDMVSFRVYAATSGNVKRTSHLALMNALRVSVGVPKRNQDVKMSRAALDAALAKLKGETDAK